MKYQITYSSITNIGKRSVNEDSIVVYSGAYCLGFVLCDGLGGHGMGDVASKLVCQVFETQFAEKQKTSDVLKIAFSAAQDILMAEQVRQHASRKMKTTAVALVLDEKKAYIGHVGDSRLYVFSGNRIMYRTLDHSVPQMLVRSKEIKDEDIRNHPDRSLLLKVMGQDWEEPQYELQKPLKLKNNLSFLLCSDGFWELINEKEMCETLKASLSVNEWLSKMSSIVQNRGENVNMDNNTAIAVWCR